MSKQLHRRFAYLVGIFITLSVSLLSCWWDPGDGPLAEIATENTRFLQGYPIVFTLELRSGLSEQDFEYSWDFGDSLMESGREVEHTYIYPGTYTIEVLTTGDTESETDTKTIEVIPSLELVASYAMHVDDPSGLSFGKNHNSLWTVSDKSNGKVVEIDLEGNNLRALPYRGQDLEGIAYDHRDSSIWIVDESLGNLIHLNSNGEVVSTQLIAGVSDGSGLEGIAIDSEHSRIFMLKEKEFGALITLDQNSLQQTITRLRFAPDYSGLFYVTSTNMFWVMSDEASMVYQMDAAGAISIGYGVDMVQPEGLVFDESEKVFYIVDDTSEKLHKYKFWDSP